LQDLSSRKSFSLKKESLRSVNFCNRLF
jgi:hypothetical protein